MKPFILPEHFLLGTATAATQIEGGDTNNNWYRWAQQGRVKDGSSPYTACDHLNHMEEDIELMRQMGNHTYRMGLEWSRIEPERGRFDGGGLELYRDLIQRVRDAGIRPLVTLWHFSHPLWFEDAGGWRRRAAVDDFLRYAEYAVRGLCDLVDDWITINEPGVYLVFSHVFGEWPPGRKSVLEYFRAARNLIRAHRRAYALIHRVAGERRTSGLREETGAQGNHATPRHVTPPDDRPRGVRLRHATPPAAGGRDAGLPDTTLPAAGRRADGLPDDGPSAAGPKVGVAHHIRIFDPASRRVTDRALARFYTWAMQRLFLERMAGGRRRKSARGADGRPRGGKRWADFLGLNYYSREMIRVVPDPARGFGLRQPAAGAPVNELGWEIYPYGLYRAIRQVWSRYRLPVWITENGICDSTDRQRPRFILEHLAEVRRLIDEGIPVQRYYHWTLTDNFEWIEGTSARFGLIAVDFSTQQRALRESARLYGEICLRRAVTAEMIERHPEPLR